MSIALNILYGIGLTAASPVIGIKMLTNPRWRRGFVERLGAIPERKDGSPCLWIHCASVGETLAARSIVGGLAQEMPDWQVAVSTTTPEGNKQAREHFNGPVFYFPIDFTFTIRSDIRKIRPTAVALVEKELWPNFISVLAQEGIPAFIVNGVVSENFVKRHHLFNKFGGAGTKMLDRIRAFCVQTQTYAERLTAIGVPENKITVTGNIKYDTMRDGIEEEILGGLRKKFQISHSDAVIVGGSTHPGEEKILLQVFGNLRSQRDGIRLILAPRHTNRAKEVRDEVMDAGFACITKSELDRQPAPADDLKNTVIIIDTLGELVNIYGLAAAAFVGGSIADVGGHNVLEPAALGVPTLFGPNVKSCRDSADILLSSDAAKTVTDALDMEATLRFILNNPVKTADMTARAREAVNRQKGATEKTISAMKNELTNAAGKPAHS